MILRDRKIFKITLVTHKMYALFNRAVVEHYWQGFRIFSPLGVATKKLQAILTYENYSFHQLAFLKIG